MINVCSQCGIPVAFGGSLCGTDRIYHKSCMLIMNVNEKLKAIEYILSGIKDTATRQLAKIRMHKQFKIDLH